MDETTLSFAAIVFAVIVTRAAIRQFCIADQQPIDALRAIALRD